MTAGSVLTSLLTVAVAVAGCAAGDLNQASTHRGDSGPVNWEIVGIRTDISDDQRQIRWSFTVILRETSRHAIQFESIETSTQTRGHPDSLMAGTEKQPFRVRLAPHGEYRFNTNYSLTFTPAAGGGFGELPGGRRGVTVLYRLMGRDEAGQNVTVAIPVWLYPGAGTQVRAPTAAPPAVTPTVPPPAPEPARAEGAPRETPAPNPAWAAAGECAARSTTLRVLDISETGGVHFEHQPGEEDEFLACYNSRFRERLEGRLVDVPGGPLRTSVAIEPLGTSFAVVVTIDGTHRARLLVDTGATLTILRPRLVERITGAVEVEGLRPSIIVATGDSVTVRLSRLRSLSVGSFEVQSLHVGVYDVVPQVPDVDGLLGTDFLHRFVLGIDSDARLLSLERKP